MAEILFPALFVLLALGLPVAFAMAISVFVALSFGSSYPNLVVVKETFWLFEFIFQAPLYQLLLN